MKTSARPTHLTAYAPLQQQHEGHTYISTLEYSVRCTGELELAFHVTCPYVHGLELAFHALHPNRQSLLPGRTYVMTYSIKLLFQHKLRN